MGIKNFNATDRTQLTKHFNVSEFRCKCGRFHPTVLDTNLVETLEKLIGVLGADKCIVSSGYRCEAHDRAVGGSGKGQHTTGKAADVCFYKEGKPISSKTVSCKAQDMGVPGIANITAAYTWIHLDVRSSGTYKGDENPDLNGGRPNYNTVTNDFYRYYEFKKENTNTNADVKTWQNAALKDGFSLPSGADGIWGSECLTVAKKAICKRDTKDFTNKALTKIIQKAVGVKADGLFGADTEKAVKEYQKKNGLAADGVVGVNTWKHILNIK